MRQNNIEQVDAVSFIVYIHPDNGKKYAAFWEMTPDAPTHMQMRSKLMCREAKCLTEGLLLYDSDMQKWHPISIFEPEVSKSYDAWREDMKVARDMVTACYQLPDSYNEALKQHLGAFFKRIPMDEQERIRNWEKVCPQKITQSDRIKTEQDNEHTIY